MDEEGFYAFWAQYPKKRAKGTALRAWKATRAQRPPIDQLLKALAVLKGSDDWRKDSGQYIPYPSTWINAWGWCDVPEVDLKDVLPSGKLWWETNAGIEAKARELGIPAWNGRFGDEPETWPMWAKRVRAIAESNKVVPLRAA